MVPKVLIVDDEEAIRCLFGQILKSAGCWCALAANAADASNLMQEHNFDPEVVVRLGPRCGCGRVEDDRQQRPQCADSSSAVSHWSPRFNSVRPASHTQQAREASGIGSLFPCWRA